MKIINAKAIGLLLALTTQVPAQRFTAMEPDSFYTGNIGYTVQYPQLTGYAPQSRQIAALGEKNSAYATLMLLGGRDTLLNAFHTEKVGTYNVVNSEGSVLGIVHPFSEPNSFAISSNDTIHDNSVTGVVVLDSLSDSKKTATVVFASLRKLVVMQITISNANGISFGILSSMNMPENMWEVDEVPKWDVGYGEYNSANYHMRRLALLGINQDGANKIYHLATGNPLSKKGNGRVDFLNIEENSWAVLQPNPNGLANGANGLVFNDSVYFGRDLAVIDNFDKKGGKALAVLLPTSKQFPQSALYIFQMDNDWTPSTKMPTVIAGNSKPWLEESDQKQHCGGLGVANFGDETPHLLVSCLIVWPASSDGEISNMVNIKDIVLDSIGNISNNSVFSSEKMSVKNPAKISYGVNSNPILIKNHKSDLYSISLVIGYSPAGYGHYSVAIFTIIDADYSKNFSIEAGIQETIINIDSLFYKSTSTGFSAKTIFGSAKCEIQGINLICQGSEKSIGSWSGIELSNSGNCDLYKACKRKDTVYVYLRSASETPLTALRVPKSMLVPYFSSVSLGDVERLSYFKNPDLQNTNLSWSATGLKLSALANTPENGISITPFSQSEGIDTLEFNLSISSANSTTINNYSVYLHVADTSKILSGAIPANPSSDTVWNTAEKRYIALPRSNSKGDAYTYDIIQDSLDVYAEIVGDYLHVLKIDLADIFVAYTENGQIKHRKITLMPEPKTLPPPPPPPNKITNLQAQGLNVAQIGGKLQISGLNGEFELRAYNLKGEEIQKEKADAQGSVFVKLRQNCPQIVQIRSGNEKISIFISQ